VALWLEFAKAYLRQGNDTAFVEVLKDGSSAEIEVRFPSVCALKPSAERCDRGDVIPP
jgi:hypothetical protein